MHHATSARRETLLDEWYLHHSADAAATADGSFRDAWAGPIAAW